MTKQERIAYKEQRWSQVTEADLKPFDTLKNGEVLGDLMTIDDFKACVEDGEFIDYDGFGDLATATMCFNGFDGYDETGEVSAHIKPSDIKHGITIPPLFTHVLWYNR